MSDEKKPTVSPSESLRDSSRAPTVGEIIDRLEGRLRDGYTSPHILHHEARTLIDGVREIDEMLKQAEVFIAPLVQFDDRLSIRNRNPKLSQWLKDYTKMKEPHDA